MVECIFCEIVNKKSPADIVYEDDDSIAFKDVNEQAPIHILVIPKKHIRSIVEIEEEDLHVIGHLVSVANKIANQKGISERGFRLVLNSGLESGQSVWHIHFHILGGRKMSWPPG
ncbi:MAG: histidine triad nucleotide-binding protein [Thermodesulfobacteriota bacterium]